MQSGTPFFMLNGQKWYGKDFLTEKLELPKRTVLELSTAHIELETDEYLGEAANTCTATGVIVYELGEAGYLISVHFTDDERTEIPKELVQLLQSADQNGADYLMLDRDGPYSGSGGATEAEKDFDQEYSAGNGLGCRCNRCEV